MRTTNSKYCDWNTYQRKYFEQLIRGLELHARLIISPTKTSKGNLLVIVLFLEIHVIKKNKRNHN